MTGTENEEWEQKAREWIETVGGFQLGDDKLQKELRNGVALCKKQKRLGIGIAACLVINEVEKRKKGEKLVRPWQTHGRRQAQGFMNVLQPGSIRKISKLPGPFNQMENIKAFLDAVEKYGLAKQDSFVTVDLFEGRNMRQVIRTIYAIGRKAQEKNAPYPPLGPKESKQNKREFTKEQMEAGKHVVAMRF